MTSRGPALLLAAVVALPILAGALLAASRPVPAGNEFQSLVGGLGLGPVVDFDPCARAFDPRIEAVCSHRHEPVPLGSLFCPAHAGP